MTDIDASPAPDKGQVVEKCGTAPQGVVDGPVLRLDIEMMKIARARLSLDDFGRLTVQIARAAAAKRPSQLQRLLLDLMTYKGDVA